MPDAFVILEPSLAETDRLWREALEPALAECGIRAARSAEDDGTGRLYEADSLRRIREASLLVADLTAAGRARHLELGYALGLGRESALILTARRDCNRNSAWFDPRGGAEAFSAGDREVLWWTPEALVEFRRALEAEARRRLAASATADGVVGTDPLWDPLWVRARRADARATLTHMRMKGFLEVRFALPGSVRQWSPEALAAAHAEAAAATAREGFALGPAYLQPHAPEADEGGVSCEVQRDGQLVAWSLRGGGDYHLIEGDFEDFHFPGALKADLRILRVARALLYAARLYAALGAPPETPVRVAMRSMGLEHRILDGLFYALPPVSETGARLGAACSAPRHAPEPVEAPLGRLEPDLAALTRRLTRETFLLFGGYAPPDAVYASLVEGYARAA